MRLSLIDQVRGALQELGPAAVLHTIANSMRSLADAERAGTYGRDEVRQAAEQLTSLARHVPPTFRFHNGLTRDEAETLVAAHSSERSSS
jgi:methyl-accepting chemotaxis protein